jgi:hypothetical protein
MVMMIIQKKCGGTKMQGLRTILDAFLDDASTTQAEIC